LLQKQPCKKQRAATAAQKRLEKPPLVELICRGLGSAKDAANIRKTCQQCRSSLDSLDVLCSGKTEHLKVFNAVQQHGKNRVPSARLRRIFTAGALKREDVWSSPLLLQYLVQHLAWQGDADLLEEVLGKDLQPSPPPTPEQQQQEQEQQQEEEEKGQHRGQEQQQLQQKQDQLRRDSLLGSLL